MTPVDVRRAAAELDAGNSFAPPDGADTDPVGVLVRDTLDLSRTTGAPRARVLRIVADAVDDALGSVRDVELASITARQSALVLTALPVATSVLAELFGFPVLAFLVGGAVGWLCIAVGSAALYLGWRWMARLRRSIVAPPLATGLLANLVAEVIASSGLRADTGDWLRDRANEWGTGHEWAAIADLRSRARETGAPVAGLLEVAATEERRTARFAVRAAIEALPGRMLAPLGACLLPAFIALTVIPAVAGMARSLATS